MSVKLTVDGVYGDTTRYLRGHLFLPVDNELGIILPNPEQFLHLELPAAIDAQWGLGLQALGLFTHSQIMGYGVGPLGAPQRHRAPGDC
jgi:hypothetical protein